MPILNVCGIRKRAILCRTKKINTTIFDVLIGITKEQADDLKINGKIIIGNSIITSDNIYSYGEFNADSTDIKYIEKFGLIESDGVDIYSNFDYDKGTVEYELPKPKVYTCYDAVKWFKYNHCLIGKPKYILLYKCNKEKL